MGLFKRTLGLQPDDQEAFAREHGLTFSGPNWPLLGARVAASPADRFNAMHGRLPGGERGALCHELRTRPGESSTGATHRPSTIAAFPLPEAIGSLLRVMALPGDSGEGHRWMREVEASAAGLPRHGVTMAPDGDEAILRAAVGGDAPALASTELHFGMGCLWLVRSGYALGDELEAFARLGSGIVHRAREAALAAHPPAEPSAELPPPRWLGTGFRNATEQFQAAFAHGLDAPPLDPLAGWIPQVAEHRGWIAEDALAFHRAFAAAPLRGQAMAAFRLSLGGRPGRLLVTFDVRPPEPWGSDVALVPVPPDVPPNPPGELHRLGDGTIVAVGGGVLGFMRPRKTRAVDGRALARLAEDATAFAVAQGW